jgi:phage terminase large subunit-like protein
LDGTRGPHFAWWCAEKLQHSVDIFDGEPFILEDWQQAIVDEALSVVDAGHRWRSVAIVLPRKNGKTALLAAYSLYRLMEDGGMPEILLAAASDKQAGRLFDAVCAFVRRAPELAEVLTIRAYVGEIARNDGEGKILRMSSSPERLHGYNPSLVVCDELAQWTTPTLRRAWAALTTGGGARQAAQTFAISTAGEAHQRTESILGRLLDGNEAEGEVERDGALTISRNTAAQLLVFNYSAQTEDPKDTKVIKAANPATWITEEFLARQAANPELTKAEFLQLHACVWAQSDVQWMPPEVWKGLGDKKKPLKAGEKIALGFDGSMFHDSTVLMACRLEDGHLTRLESWECPPGHAGDEWEVPRAEVDSALAEAMDTYQVVQAYFDPPYWQTDIARWAQEYGSVIMEFPTASMARIGPALERFRTDALRGEFSHDGDSMLHRHVVNARTAPTRSGYKLEKPGRKSEEKIDGAIAAVLAYEARCDAVAGGALASKKLQFA